jgi:protein-disulfide isomerase
MSEEQATEESSATSVSHVAPQSTLMKDLLIPISIIIAGAFIGAGLYFGGSSPVGSGAPAAVEAPGTGNPLLDLVIAAGVDEAAFTSCFENGDTLPQVQEDLDDAIATGGRGTPWGIVIGKDGKKYPLNGALPQATIEQLIAIAREGGDLDGAEEATEIDNLAPVTEADHIKGNLDAEVIVVEFSDFDCPFCTRFHATMNAIVAKYPPNEVAWVYRHFPLESLHPNAKAVSVASECVAKLGGNEAFWKFTDGYLK